MIRNTGAMLVNQGGRTILQALFFIILARALGVRNYGAFAATTALVGLLAPYGSLGAISLMIRRVALDHDLAAQEYVNALAITVLGNTALTIVLLILSPYFAPRGLSIWVVLLIAASELFGTRLVEVAGAIFQAREQMFYTAIFWLLLPAGRLAGAIVLLVGPWRVDLFSWSIVYGISSVVMTGCILSYTTVVIGRGRVNFENYRTEWRDGLMFSIGISAQTVYDDIDKVMLARLATIDATGIYTAAYRVVDMAFMPMRALLGASYPRFFRHGQHGLGPAVGFTKKIAKPGLGYCVVASLGLFAGANLVPVILGSSYEDSVGVLRGLAILPLIRGVHYLAADSLTGAGKQALRSVAQISVAVLNVVLNFWLIPAFSYGGAVAASLVSDGALALMLWGVVLWQLRSERNTAAQGSPVVPVRDSDF